MTGKNGEARPSTSRTDEEGNDAQPGNVIGQLSSGVYAAIPLSDCPHLSSVKPVPSSGIDTSLACGVCSNPNENWICLICYGVFCSRYVNAHGVEHSQVHSHPMALSFSDISVWCYECGAYVHNSVLSPAKEAVYLSKFGEQPPLGFSRTDLHPTDETQSWD